MSIDPKKFGLSDSLVGAVSEALKGGQKKIDVAPPYGKLTGADFKKLRGEDKDKEQAVANEQSPAEYAKANFKHDMMGHDKKMKNEVADGSKANFKQNMKEGSKPDFLDFDKDGNKKEPMKQALKQTKEEVQVDELSDKTLQSYRTKALAHKSGHSPSDSPEERAKKNLKVKNRDQGKRVSWGKMIQKGVRVGAGGKQHPIGPSTNASGSSHPTKSEGVEFAEAAPTVAGANVADQMAARKAEVQRKIAQKQATAQQAKSNKRLSGTMKETKCTCGETKESKMACEAHGGKHDKDAKLGREPVTMNPPLREAGELPKKVVSKGHEIAKSLIRHKTKVDNPYAVGMATAKKSAGIKEDAEQVDEISKGTLGSYVGKAANANYGKEKLEREKGVNLAMKKITGRGVKIKGTKD